MSRNHIHCAVGLSGDKAVTSGEYRLARWFLNIH